MKILRRLSGILLIACLTARAPAAGVTPELQKNVRSATFEVVMKKPQQDPLSYEKPLPLELLPYIERTDAYRSIGTAFALGDNTYVTAAHVIIACIGSQFGAPALRGADGRVHAITRLLKFSAHEDFALFSIADDPAPAPLPINRRPALDDPVLAIGNALGEGIVIRDGLFTSETAEEQDGRWKWIRFSAAASPGNSGGPLLDANGAVVGIVIGKSANENLNYALPITRALDAPAGVASFEQRSVDALPFLRATHTHSYQQQFPLPSSWSGFVTAYREVIDTQSDRSRNALLTEQAATMFPRGPGVEALLYDVQEAYDPALLGQGSDGNWQINWASFRSAELPDDGFVRAGSAVQSGLLRLHRSGNATDAAFYQDSKAFMDQALKALNLRREVGGDSVLVTSLGPARSETLFTDRYGRRWQERVWALPYLDAWLVALLLPTPDGYVAIVQLTPSLLLREVTRRAELDADLLYASYWGTLGQWQSFLAQRGLLPEALQKVKLGRDGEDGAWRLSSPRLSLAMNPRIFKVAERSMLGVQMTYLQEAAGTVWDIGALQWFENEHQKSYVALRRQPQVPATARRELRDRWQDMLERHSPYTGEPARVAAAAWTVESVLDAPGAGTGTTAADLVYGLTVHIEDPASYQAVLDAQSAARTAVRITEIGNGQRMVAAADTTTGDAASQLEGEIDQYLQTTATVAADLRGRRPADDLRDHVLDARTKARIDELRKQEQQARAARRSADESAASERLEQLIAGQRSLFDAITAYWKHAAAMTMAHTRWDQLLQTHTLPADYAHAPQVTTLEAQLRDHWRELLEQRQLEAKSIELLRAYADERLTLARQLAGSSASLGSTPPAQRFQERSDACPDPAADPPSGTHAAVVLFAPSTNEYYPADSRHLYETGRVFVDIRIDATGCARAAGVRSTSGSDQLDQAGIIAMLAARFSPATSDGRAVDSIKTISVRFEMDDRN